MNFKIDQQVLFFTRSILEITEGKIIGIFVSPLGKDETDYKYIYQIEYLKKHKDKESELLIAVPENNDFIADALDDRDMIEEAFKPFHEKSIGEDLKQAKEDLERVEGALVADQELIKIIKEKIKELKAIKF